MKHPIQPTENDGHGVLRFKENKIVTHLLEGGPFDMNTIAVMNFTQEDREQFAQLIGYSLSGYSELDYVSEETYEAAEKMGEGKNELEARNDYLRETIKEISKSIKEAATVLFKIHPDDLES